MDSTPARRPARALGASASDTGREAARRARQRRALVVFGVPVLAFFGLAIAHRATAHPAAGATTAHDRKVALSVGVTTCTFVDASRATPQFDAAGPIGETKGRRLVTEIRYPTIHPVRGESETAGAAPARRRGPFPLIVFAHGYDTTPDTYRALLDAWVRAGFVVAAPIFPDSNTTYVTTKLGGSDIGESDLVNQPGDVAFVARTVLADSATLSPGCRVVHRLVRAAAGLGLAGQSDGATTVGMLAYDVSDRAALTGLRLRAVALFSGAPEPDARYGPAPGAPRALVVQSATDQCNLPVESIDLYNDLAGGEKAFLEILDATHLGPYTGSAPAPFALVARVSTALFELSLDRSLGVAAFEAVGRSAPTVGLLTVNGTAPAIPSGTFSAASCYAG